MSKSILIIILNWNCADDTVEAIRSVYASKVEPYCYDIFLVDNGSKDDSVQTLRAFFASGGFRVEEIRDLQMGIAEKGTKKIFFYISPVNTGFAGGNNIGMRFALKNGYDFVFLLNADAMVSRDCIRALAHTMDKDRRIGIVGPKVYYFDFNGKKNVINFAGGKFDVWRGESIPIGRYEEDMGQYNGMYDTEYVEGSAFMVRTGTLTTVGLFDENYFAYWEECDLCTRARKSGWRVCYTGDTWIRHKIQSSIRKNSIQNFDLARYYSFRNRLYFVRKHRNIIMRFTTMTYTIYQLTYMTIGKLIKEQGKDISTAVIFARNVLFDFITGRMGEKRITGLK